MRTKLSPVAMKYDDDPRMMFNQLARIQIAYNNATQMIGPYDLIAWFWRRLQKSINLF
jgi:hypothetical protein